MNVVIRHEVDKESEKVKLLVIYQQVLKMQYTAW